LRAISVVTAGACAVFVACSGTSDPAAPGAPASISFAVPTATVALRGDITLAPIVRDGAGLTIVNLTGVTWESSNPQRASVDVQGVVRGVELGGPVTIRARLGTLEGSAQVTVVPAEVRITPAVTALGVGTTVQLELAAFDALDTPIAVEAVAWTSNTPSVTTIDPVTGFLTAIAPGTSTIRATTELFYADVGIFVGVPQAIDGEYVSTNTPNLDARMTVFLGRITRFTADFRPYPECQFEFSATPNLVVSGATFNFQLSNWTSTVSGTFVSDEAVVGGVGAIPASLLSPGCLLRYGLANVGNLSTRNVVGPSFALYKP